MPKIFSRPPVMICAGSDELLAWIPKITEESCRQKLEKLKERFSVMIRRSALNLNFQAGIARGDESVTTTSLLRRGPDRCYRSGKAGDRCPFLEMR